LLLFPVNQVSIATNNDKINEENYVIGGLQNFHCLFFSGVGKTEDTVFDGIQLLVG
jgi:hypothetical protein